MKILRHRVFAGAAIVTAAAAWLAACSDVRKEFDSRPDELIPDAALPEAPECGRQCSLDGRSVIESCGGTVVEVCAADRACGAGRCQDPCAAAAADRSSNG